MDRIITSLLETDAYKFSMGQAIYHQYSEYKTTWSFKCRNTDVKFTKEMVEEIKNQIKMYCDLRFNEEELSYLDSIKWIRGSYIDYLRLWKPRFDDFYFGTDAPCGLTIETKGTWLNTSMYEIPTLAIVNEVYFRMAYDYDELFNDFKDRLNKKVEALKSGEYELGAFSEFGLRRRLSKEAQDLAVKTLKDAKMKDSFFVGTSNVYLAYKLGLTPIGTYAHEFVQMYQGIEDIPVAMSNKVALKEWFEEYQGDLGTALTDTLTTDCFLKDFDRVQANHYTGVRQDSGDPIAWGEKMINHYEKLRIDPKNKLLLFSDSLNFDKAQAIYEHFCDRINVSFGIGTFITNDTCVEPLNIVIKLQYVNDRPVAKISDNPEKAMCQDDEYLEYLKSAVKRRIGE